MRTVLECLSHRHTCKYACLPPDRRGKEPLHICEVSFSFHLFFFCFTILKERMEMQIPDDVTMTFELEGNFRIQQSVITTSTIGPEVFSVHFQFF